jgi:hypothetical protein
MKENGAIKLIINFIIGLFLFIILSNGIEFLLVLINGGKPNFIYFFIYNFNSLFIIYLISFILLFCNAYTYKLFVVKKINLRLEKYRKERQVYE